MRDKEARQMIERLERRLMMLESDDFRFIGEEGTSYPHSLLSRPFHKISVKQVVESMLGHLGLGIIYVPAENSKAKLIERLD